MLSYIPNRALAGDEYSEDSDPLTRVGFWLKAVYLVTHGQKKIFFRLNKVQSCLNFHDFSIIQGKDSSPDVAETLMKIIDPEMVAINKRIKPLFWIGMYPVFAHVTIQGDNVFMRQVAFNLAPPSGNFISLFDEKTRWRMRCVETVEKRTLTRMRLQGFVAENLDSPLRHVLTGLKEFSEKQIFQDFLEHLLCQNDSPDATIRNSLTSRQEAYVLKPLLANVVGKPRTSIEPSECKSETMHLTMCVVSKMKNTIANDMFPTKKPDLMKSLNKVGLYKPHKDGLNGRSSKLFLTKRAEWFPSLKD
eukprot:Lithocolla_globosa_v1_NODE_3660_length_1611_cov_41.660026.p1 type:complete len:304 gc:universal NODE_3660_length_1611_cov_41.660026:615-1526(+)